MSAFNGLSLVIEPNDLLERLDAPELILVDLTSSARYEAGHIRGARFVDRNVRNWANLLHQAYCPTLPICSSCSASWATIPMQSMSSTMTKAAAGPGVLSGCWMSSATTIITIWMAACWPGKRNRCR